MAAVPTPSLGRLSSVHRYPVKSLTGEALERVSVQARGLAGDRLWSVRDRDGKLGSGKSTRRFRKMDGLLALAARYHGDTPVIEFPDGVAVSGDDPGVHAALSAHVGRELRLSREQEVSHFDEGPVHLLTTSTLRSLEHAHRRPVDVRRLRPNLVVSTADQDGFVEDAWVGRHVAVGHEVVLAVRAGMPRCVMLTLPQRDLPEDPRLLRAATAANDALIGVVADVVRGGEVAVGDEVRFVG
jgi:uncharacterized protein YcbX